jgi:hypothetical protein
MKKIFLFTLTLFAVQFSQAQWEDDFRLTEDDSLSKTTLPGSGHAIATSGDSIHVVWYDNRNWINAIYYKQSVDGGLTWGEDLRISNGFAWAGYPCIALSGSVVHAAWCVNVGGYTEIFYTRSNDGGNIWGEESRLTFTPRETINPCITVSGSFVHLVYYDFCEGYWEIYYKRSTDEGLTWEADVRLTNDPGASLYSSICSSGSDIHVTWYDTRNGQQEIYYKRSTDNGLSWGADTRLTNNNLISWFPSVGVSGSDVYIVWSDNRDGNDEIYFKRSTDGGLNWGADTRLTNNSGISWCPNLSVSGAYLFVVWVDDSDGNKEIYYKFSTDGGDNWGPDIRLTDDPAESNGVFISISGSKVHVVWYDYRDGNYEIYYKRDPTGGLPVGLEEEPMRSAVGQIDVYPNLANRQLTVGQSAVGGWQSAVRLSIVDLYGREIKEFKNISSFPCQLDISELRNGEYFLRVINEEGESGSVKFIKIDD